MRVRLMAPDPDQMFSRLDVGRTEPVESLDTPYSLFITAVSHIQEKSSKPLKQMEVWELCSHQEML